MKMLGTRIEKRFGLGVVFIFSIIILFAFLGAIIPISTPAKKAMEKQQEIQQKAMEQQLLTAATGDLAEGFDGTLVVVNFINPNHNDISMTEMSLCKIGRQCGPNEHQLSRNIARLIKRIIRKTDPDYPAAAVKFISQ